MELYKTVKHHYSKDKARPRSRSPLTDNENRANEVYLQKDVRDSWTQTPNHWPQIAGDNNKRYDAKGNEMIVIEIYD